MVFHETLIDGALDYLERNDIAPIVFADDVNRPPAEVYVILPVVEDGRDRVLVGRGGVLNVIVFDKSGLRDAQIIHAAHFESESPLGQLEEVFFRTLAQSNIDGASVITCDAPVPYREATTALLALSIYHALKHSIAVEPDIRRVQAEIIPDLIARSYDPDSQQGATRRLADTSMRLYVADVPSNIPDEIIRKLLDWPGSEPVIVNAGTGVHITPDMLVSLVTAARVSRVLNLRDEVFGLRKH